jgi:hypothetical protein
MKTVIRVEACRMSLANFCIRGWNKCNNQQNKSWLHFNTYVRPRLPDLEMSELKFQASFLEFLRLTMI